MSTVVAPLVALGFSARLSPPALARVWIGDGRHHETIAVPGVTLVPGEALAVMELATVCGSDVHTIAGHRSSPTPTVLGHEFVGRVLALGDDSVTYVDGSRVRIGDRIVWSIFASCQVCDRCLRGMPQKCRSVRKYGHERIAPRWELSGGFATHMHLRAGTAIVRAPERLSAEVLAPASCGTATAWAAVDAVQTVTDLSDAVVMISGAGLIGLTATAIATVRGARVIVVDPDPARRELALRFGAVAALSPANKRGLTAAVDDQGAAEISAVIEASGARPAVQRALDVVGVGGTIVLVGSVFATEPLPLDPEAIVRACVTVRGVHNYPPQALASAVAFLDTHAKRLPFDELVGVRFPLSRLDDAVAAAAAHGAPVRVAVDPTR